MRVLGRPIPVSLLVYTTRHCILVRWPLYEERVSSPMRNVYPLQNAA